MMELGRAAGVAALLSAMLAVPARGETQVDRGRYLATIMDCGGCHTTGMFVGKPDFSKYVAGYDVGWSVPGLGVFYPSNLTPDRETGIGDWSEDDIVRTLRTGTTPDGRQLAHIMPWRAYSEATDADLHALAAYLKTVPAVRHVVPGPTPIEAVKTPYVTVAEPAR